MNRQYFQHLCDIIDGSNCYNMLWLLHSVEFKSLVEGDSNRAADALRTRELYPKNGMTKGATVLEVLVTLAVRCEKDIMHDEQVGDRTAEWFWMMMTNIGLSEKIFNDDYWCDSRVDKVLDKIHCFNDRTYNRDGSNGGLFPLKSTRRDIRKVELWYQMNWYLLENYEYELM